MNDQTIQFPYQDMQWRALLEKSLSPDLPERGRIIAEAVPLFSEFDDIIKQTSLSFDVPLYGTDEQIEKAKEVILAAVRKYQDMLIKEMFLLLIRRIAHR